MGLNKQTGNGNMYAWLTHTWNPLGGECPHQCSYCSVQAFTQRHEVLRKKYSGKPKLITSELKTSLGRDNIIFVCNMTDLFADKISEGQIKSVLKYCQEYPENTYLFQSKNPGRFSSPFRPEDFPSKIILCTTIESNYVYSSGKAPLIIRRAEGILKAKAFFPDAQISVTIEPIMDFNTKRLLHILTAIKPDFISIGANSRPTNLPEPNEKKLVWLIDELKKFTRIEKKSNLERLLNSESAREEKEDRGWGERQYGELV